ncbi:FAD-dependent monooxygenase [Anaplasma phagocytophilum]|uniref:Ubiquinone biosynthesis hydroxylase, UbiH/UbiF/VisC/COQ6 family n=1 Tax=Anaplasma phagocytophilum (strain HZ) TaxID=212042 RepID=Q2GLV4_ANAPZ|nr:FAD-dependent monooxygenase [Anaplasma phagocytophilum]KJZ98866.1 ubiquinone biosynthesis hydroxylase, UbiH/UbiF/VisC/COQ6 family protein [Anaplasma phagocytophilum str. CR1007]ABD43480.1 ubiquinone biosynthesis hydroxylase, UbiH/UbiF/VisC/COQ6 family [Anaplasma phagocytophilum str. HZ]AGR78543.1 2-octaprenyl-3-methyl-6-methoxy-1,4-benzoquinol hydroxylase [Anaplasma phagocytophilum str. HZ2]AGR79790.1 2-octaprenyl-3-methyl-6-methoxy-1,4-benzoquinol hydroxylase [Anaplasma phagocytophilum str.
MVDIVSNYYDVVILGGGINGVLCAIGLSHKDISVLVVEERDAILDGNQGRVYAFSKRSKEILENFSVWNDEIRSSPIDHIMIYDGNSCSSVHYDRVLVDDQPMGYVVEASEIAKFMHQKLNFDVITSSSCKLFTVKDGFAEIYLSCGKKIYTKLVVCAEGKNSRFRNSLSLKTINYAFEQGFIVCNINHSKHHRNTAIEHFCTNGPFAILPMYGGYSSSIVWTEKYEMAQLIQNLPIEEFTKLLQEKCSDFLGKIEVNSKINCYKTSMSLLKKIFINRAIIIGDAAHAIHPVAGQGLNLGIRDVGILVEIIEKYHKLGSDIGQRFILQEIDNRRLLDNVSMSFVCTGINSIFSNDSAILKVARRATMSVVEMSPTLKKILMSHAMGISSICK